MGKSKALFTTFKVKAFAGWSDLLEPDQKFDRYQLDMMLDDTDPATAEFLEALKLAEEAGIAHEKEVNGATGKVNHITITAAGDSDPKVFHGKPFTKVRTTASTKSRPIIRNANNEDITLDGRLPFGSEILVAVTAISYSPKTVDKATSIGIKLHLNGVRILSYGGMDRPDPFEDDEYIDSMVSNLNADLDD